MRQLLFLVLLGLCCTNIFAQSGNPFASIGKQGKILTLSHGKYVEVYSNDSLQRIGSVVMNMNTGKVQEFLDATETEPPIESKLLTRWYSLDPLAEKFPNMSPYNFCANNPILFVDPDGRENAIYLQVLSSAYKDLTKKEIKNIVTTANNNFAEMGLNTRVFLAKGNVEYNKLDKTDAVAYIGSGNDVISKVKENSPEFASDMAKSDFNKEGINVPCNPEKSENNIGNNNIIGINSSKLADASREWEESKSNIGGFLINHGAGHNALLWHGGDEVNTVSAGKVPVPFLSVMMRGDDIRNGVLGLNGFNWNKDWASEPLQHLISSPDNKHGVINQSYIHRFGTKTATPTLPTQK